MNKRFPQYGEVWKVDGLKQTGWAGCGGKGSTGKGQKPKARKQSVARGRLILPAHTTLSVSSAGSPGESTPLGPRLYLELQ